MQIRRTGKFDASRLPLTILVADGSHLLTYTGLRGGENERVRVAGRPDLQVPFSGAIAGLHGAPVEWDGGSGILANLGERWVVVEVYKTDVDLVVGAAGFGPRDGDIARAATKRETALGEIAITSGALAITSAPEPPEKLTQVKLGTVEVKGAARFYWGVVLRVDPGWYRVTHETVEREGADDARLRITRGRAPR